MRGASSAGDSSMLPRASCRPNAVLGRTAHGDKDKFPSPDIKTIFDCARSLHKDHDTDLETAVHQAVEAHNTVERVDGYWPTQWAYGRD